MLVTHQLHPPPPPPAHPYPETSMAKNLDKKKRERQFALTSLIRSKEKTIRAFLLPRRVISE